jgi:phosphoglycolate phosphatase-like HAD superfamily hydrolase
MARLARQYQVVVSIGDHDEDEQASRAAGVPFVRVTRDNLEQAWREVARLVTGLDPPATSSLPTTS